MFFILFVTLTCYSITVIAKDIAQYAGAGGWITILVTAFVFALVSAGIVALNNMFKGQMFFDYAPSLVGKPITYLFALFYIIYLMFILIFLITGMTKVVNYNFLLKTPSWSLAMLTIILLCFIVYKGVTCVARLAEVAGIIFIGAAIFIHALMVIEGNVDWILPVFNTADIGKYIEGFKGSIFPFLGIEVLLVFPLATKIRRPVRTAFISVLAIGLFYVFIVESCIMKVGLNHIVGLDNGLITAIQSTTPDLLARLDILYVTVGFGGLFVGISIVMLAIIEYLCRVFKHASRLVVVATVGVITFIIFLLVNGVKGYEDFAQSLGMILGIAAIVLPLGLLMFAKIKNRKKRGKIDAV